jgi:uncharacterized damage-inducible protein DinB
MKDLLLKYAGYNLWANQQLLDAIRQLTEEKINQEIVSSFSSIMKTVLHLLDAENIWWQRLKLAEKITVPSIGFTGNINDAETQLIAQSKAWESWVMQANERQLLHVLGYQNSKKEQFKQPVSEILLHLFNHGSYHRGQLITMLRQIGVEKVPQTDFTYYLRIRK